MLTLPLFAALENSIRITYEQVLLLWSRDAAFRKYFNDLIASHSFKAFRWETPPVTSGTISQPFEFVLVDSPRFSSRKIDAQTFEEYFTDDDADHGIVTFKNLRGDATLIVPSPRTVDDVYGHLAAFVRSAPDSQIDAFWRVIGTTVQSAINDTPIWLSTAGGGVAWLHARLDSTPKYYNYSPYKSRRIK